MTGVFILLALGLGVALGWGFGRTSINEETYCAGWHDALERLAHPAERRRRPLPPRPLPERPRRERGMATPDAMLLGLTIAAVLILGSMVFGGPS